MTVSAVLLAFAAVALGAVLLALRRRRLRADGRLRIYDLMHLRGVPLPGDRASAPDVAAAERRCAACASKELCDELLAAGASDGYRRFCPNALYVEWLRSNSLRFD